MGRILTYNELKQTVNELEKDLLASLRAKEAIFRAKEQLEGIFNAVPDQIAVVDRHYRIKIVNRSLADKLNGSQERLVGELCYNCICRADGPPSLCPHAQMLKDGREHKLETYNEQLGMYLLITSSPLYDDEGKLEGGVYVARDNTIYKEIEKAWRESEEKYRLLVENAHDAILRRGIS
jgi:PAS domain-containing protein